MIKAERFSKLWWLAILFTTGVAALFTILFVKLLTTWSNPSLLIAVAAVVMVCDTLIARSMEATAPSRIDIGPGEKGHVDDSLSETATVVSGFVDSERGRVAIRGETWHAVRVADEQGVLDRGVAVRVVERSGLTLIVSDKLHTEEVMRSSSDPERG